MYMLLLKMYLCYRQKKNVTRKNDGMHLMLQVFVQGWIMIYLAKSHHPEDIG